MGQQRRGDGRRMRGGGFTFVEVLAALLFLALVVPAIVTALTLSNKASEFTERSGAAGALAENKLNEMLTADTWQAAGSSASGDCGPDWPGYRWEMAQSPWSGGGNVGGSSGGGGTSPSPAAGTGSGSSTGSTGSTTLTELKITVFFKVQGVERNVALTTVVNSLTSSSATSTTSTSTSGGAL